MDILRPPTGNVIPRLHSPIRIIDAGHIIAFRTSTEGHAIGASSLTEQSDRYDL